MIWKVPYLNAGNAWGLNTKNDGTGALQAMQESHPTYTSIQTLQLPNRMALLLYLFLSTLEGECELKAVNLQISAFPVPKSRIHLADAAAIKVCPL
jgi:hypothetical protein